MVMKRKPIALAVVAVFGGAFIGGAAQAQQSVERIEVTGTSIKRVATEGALPVTTITREDIERSGVTTAQDLVNLIPSNFGGYNANQNVGATGVPSTANLRSLGSKYTLVLLNGRRVADFGFGNSFIDLNSIPLAAVERIEVLRDGASAIYGADAVAGVINFILKKDFQGVEVSGYQTKVTEKGGDVRNASFLGGFGDLNKNGYNVMLNVYHEDGNALKATQRSFANSAVRPDLGINKSSPRNGIPNLNFTDTKGNKYTGINPFRYLNCDAPAFGLAPYGVPTSATQCGTDYVKFIDLVPEQTHDNVVARATFQLNPGNQAYVEAVQTKDHMVSVYSPAPYTKNMTYPTSGRFYPKSITLPKGMTLPKGYVMPDGTVLTAATVLQADMAVTPTGPLSGTWRTVAGGGRTDITDNHAERYTVGVKGAVADWDYDAAVTVSKFTGLVSFGPGKFSYTALTPLLASGAINVFGAQDAASQAALDSALLHGPEQTSESKSTSFDIKVSKEIMQLAAGPVGVAFGGTFRKENLAQVSMPVLATGDEVGGSGPIPAVSGGRKVYAFFGEASIPITKQLEAQLAARYDSYKNDFGVSFSNTSPKIGFRYQPSKEVVVRGSAAQGFRAPTLYENLRPFTEGNNTSGNYNDPIRCPNGVPITNTVNPVGALQDECAVQQTTATGGNKDLKPEKSTQFSLGLVYAPSNNFSASVDYWDIRINDAIIQLSEISAFNNPTAYQNNFYRFNPANYPDGYTYDCGLNDCGLLKPGSTNKDYPIAYVYLPYMNSAQFYAAGLDFNLQWKGPQSSWGQFGVALDGTYFTKHGYQYSGAAKVSDLGTYKDFGPTPRWRHMITFSYGRGPWKGSVTNNYTSGYWDFTDDSLVGGTNYPEQRKVKAYSTWDGRLNWSGIKGVDIGVGVRNLLNTEPPSSRTTLNFQTGYDAGLADPHGRTYYISAKYKFL